MITYFYWLVVIVLAMGALYLFGRMDKWKPAVISALVVLLAGWGAYYFHFQQLLVKRWGGVMSISVPKGQWHVAATWKEDNLWVENYDPETNTCIFQEYSRGNVLEGKVVIKNCNPLRAPSKAIRGDAEPAAAPTGP